MRPANFESRARHRAASTRRPAGGASSNAAIKSWNVIGRDAAPGYGGGGGGGGRGERGKGEKGREGTRERERCAAIGGAETTSPWTMSKRLRTQGKHAE